MRRGLDKRFEGWKHPSSIPCLSIAALGAHLLFGAVSHGRSP